jgi:hypothetical protein
VPRSSSPFPLFLAIDYSGARTPSSRLAGLQVYAARAGEFRLTECWTSSAKSTSHFDVQASA